MKIPTILGLLLLAISLGAGIFLYRQYQLRTNQEQLLLEPQNIKIVNISDSGATIVWETQKEAVGSILWGQNTANFQPDDRDKNPTARLTHFVTIKDLEADEKFTFKIKNNQFLYSKGQQFTTAKEVAGITDNKPILGTVINSNFEPVEDALILLSVPDGSELATFTLQSGSFLLSTTQLYKKSLEESFQFESDIEAKLFVYKKGLSSEVMITLPAKNEPLPQIVLGQNSDFRQSLVSDQQINPYDLNQDGEVNSLDLTIVHNNFGTNPTLPDADINLDGVVDKKDIEELKFILR